MKKFFVLLLVISLIVVVNSAGCSKVPPGYGGIVVNMYGSQRGVEDFTVETGMIWFNPITKDVYKYPTFLQSIVWTKDVNEGSPVDESITFNSVEGTGINADISMSYAIKFDKIPNIYVMHKKPIEEVTDVYIRSQVRDAFSRHASQYRVMDIFGTKKQELLTKVKEDLNSNLGKQGFEFDMVSFVNELRVDDNVRQAINAVIVATQKATEAENKIREAQAQADQKIATAYGDSVSTLMRANADAEANRIINKSLTKDLIEYRKIGKWDGKVPQVQGGAIPLLSLE